MGLISSWIGIQGIARGDLLAELGLEETGEEGDFFHVARPFSICETSGGWLILYANDFDWASPERVRELSRFGSAIGGQFDDKVTNSTTLYAAREGQSLWKVAHPSQKKDQAFDVTGTPPPELAQVVRDSSRPYSEGENEQEVREEIGFEVPLALGEAICGFRYDDGDHLFRGLKTVEGGWAASVNVYTDLKGKRSCQRGLIAAVILFILLMVGMRMLIGG